VAVLVPLTVMISTENLPEPFFSMYNLEITGEGVDQHPGGKRYIALRQKISDIIDERRGAEILKQQAAARAQAEAEIARRQEEEMRKAEEESKAVLDAMDPFNLAGYYGYGIEDARVNSKSLRSAHGTVVLTRQDLTAGQMNIDVRLYTIDKMQTLLLSEDGGRTWRELPVSTALSFSIEPLPGKEYDLLLRAKTTDQREVMMRVFNGVDGIVYQDVDFTQLVAETLKNIADAYERQDIGSFGDQISRDYLGNKTMLEEGARFDFDLFTSIRLTIYINRIEQRANNMFVAETKWDKAQNPRTTGQEQRTSGKTTFMFVLEDGKMKIKNLRGDLIYATLSPQIAQASGKSAAIVDAIRTAQEDRNPTQPGAGTTEDDGGVDDGEDDDDGGDVLTVYTATLEDEHATMPPDPADESMDFSSRSVVAGEGGDISLGINSLWAIGTAGIKEVGTTFDATTNASAVTGADTSVFALTPNMVCIFITNEGYYGKLEVISNTISDEDLDGSDDLSVLQFRYAVQTDLSENVATQ